MKLTRLPRKVSYDDRLNYQRMVEADRRMFAENCVLFAILCGLVALIVFLVRYGG